MNGHITVRQFNAVLAQGDIGYLIGAHLIAFSIIESDVSILGIVVDIEGEDKRIVGLLAAQAIGINAAHGGLLCLPLGDLVVLHQVEVDVLALDSGTG